jgi:hypothetical protein
VLVTSKLNLSKSVYVVEILPYARSLLYSDFARSPLNGLSIRSNCTSDMLY